MSERGVAAVGELQPTREIRGCHGAGDSMCWDRSKGLYSWIFVCNLVGIYNT